MGDQSKPPQQASTPMRIDFSLFAASPNHPPGPIGPFRLTSLFFHDRSHPIGFLECAGRDPGFMTTAAGCRSLFRCPVTPDTTIVKCPFGHNLIKVSVLRISRIAVFAMMAYVALVQFRNPSRTN